VGFPTSNFHEANSALQFDRGRPRPAVGHPRPGTSDPFETGDERAKCILVPWPAGAMSTVQRPGETVRSMNLLAQTLFKAPNLSRTTPFPKTHALRMDTAAYAEKPMAPPPGDGCRLPIRKLILEVRRISPTYGEEVKSAAARLIRPTGMGQAQTTRARLAPSTRLITNALILDWWGWSRPTSCLRRGAHLRERQGGATDIRWRFTNRHRPGTEAHPLARVTSSPPEALDTHIHFICRKQIETALASGGHHPAGAAPPGHRSTPHLHPRRLHIGPHLQAAATLPVTWASGGEGQRQHPRSPRRARFEPAPAPSKLTKTGAPPPRHRTAVFNSGRQVR